MAYYGNSPADVALVVGQDVITTTEIQDATIATADIASDAITATKVDDDGTGFQMGSLGLGTAVSGSHKLTVGGTATFSGDITGTLATASQGNITSVGTLTTLQVGGQNSTPKLEWFYDHSNGNDYKANISLAGNDLEVRGSSGIMEFYTGAVDGASSTLALSINSSQDATFAGTITVGASNGSEEVKANRTRVRHLDGLADASDYSHGDLYINHISTGNIICSSNVGVGHTTPQFGLTLLEGDLDANSIGWESSGNTKRGSIRMNPADYMKFNIGGGDRFWIGANASNWAVNVTGASPYAMQLTTTSDGSSSHDAFVIKRLPSGGSLTKVYEIFNDGAIKTYGDSSSLNFYNTAGTLRAFLQLSSTGLIIDTDSFIQFKPNNTVSLDLYSDKSAQFHGNPYPSGNNTINLGASGARWSVIYTSNSVNVSDETTKKYITDCDLGVDFINSLKPKSYKMKGLKEGHDDYNRKHFGLIAQDLIDTELNDSVFGDKDGEYSLAYNDLIAPMIKSIQELSAKVTALENA